MIALSGAVLAHAAETNTAANQWTEVERIPQILLRPAVDDALVQTEFSRVGGRMAERGQLLSKAALFKSRSKPSLELPAPSVTVRDDADLATRCRDAAVVVGRVMQLGQSNAWVALPATGFFISASGAFVTSSHVIHEHDYAGMVVMTGDGRVLPVKSILADDENSDVAVLKAEGATVAALPIEESGDIGTRVFVISHPVGRFFTLTQGVVTRRSVQRDGPHSQAMLEISAEFGPGSSGGPVLNQRGNVIGWVNSLCVWDSAAR